MTNAFKEVAPYLIALVIIIGGGAMLIIPTQVPASDLLPFITATIGSALTWVFANRTQQQTAASTTASIFTSPPVLNGNGGYAGGSTAPETIPQSTGGVNANSGGTDSAG